MRIDLCEWPAWPCSCRVARRYRLKAGGQALDSIHNNAAPCAAMCNRPFEARWHRHLTSVNGVAAMAVASRENNREAARASHLQASLRRAAKTRQRSYGMAGIASASAAHEEISLGAL